VFRLNDRDSIADKSRQIQRKFADLVLQNFRGYRPINPQILEVKFPQCGGIGMLVARFCRDRQGGVAPLLALGIVPLVLGVGAAVDYSRANSARTAMQSALDGAALMLAKEAAQGSTSALGQSASVLFNANFALPHVQGVQVTAAASPMATGTSLALSATGSIKTLFMSLVGLSALNMSVHSTAAAIADGLGCVLALDPDASGAVTGQGSTSVTLNGCSLYDNSQNQTALTVGGSARVFALSVGVVGGISGAENLTTMQGVTTGSGPVKDPYANDSFPSFFGCTEKNFTAKSAVTINPGVYCGGMRINAGAELTLNPGIYYLDGGGLSVNGGATITGIGVTLVFTKKNSNDWATATINGDATVNLTPPTFGPTAGIVIFGDRNIPLGSTFKFNGGASQYFGGAIYLPTAAITFAGGAGTSTNCTQIIGNTITFVGNSSLAVNCSNHKTKPFSVTVLKLTS
jgi:Putative Flp pilus-assembly TadE/G-like